MSDKDEALRLAGELVAPVGTQSTYSVMQQAAAELRRQHEKLVAMTHSRDQWQIAAGNYASVCTEWRKRAEKAVAERDALRAALIVAEEASARCKAVNDTTSECWRAECDALRAELDRLTTLRPASEPGAEMQVLWHYKTTPTLSLERWTLREGDLIGWSPIPEVKEAK